jgi:hypothetical protein
VVRSIAGCYELCADVCFTAAVHCALLLNHILTFRSINCVEERTPKLCRGSDVKIDSQIRFSGVNSK